MKKILFPLLISVFLVEPLHIFALAEVTITPVTTTAQHFAENIINVEGQKRIEENISKIKLGDNIKTVKELIGEPSVRGKIVKKKSFGQMGENPTKDFLAYYFSGGDINICKKLFLVFWPDEKLESADSNIPNVSVYHLQENLNSTNSKIMSISSQASKKNISDKSFNKKTFNSINTIDNPIKSINKNINGNKWFDFFSRIIASFIGGLLAIGGSFFLFSKQEYSKIKDAHLKKILQYLEQCNENKQPNKDNPLFSDLFYHKQFKDLYDNFNSKEILINKQNQLSDDCFNAFKNSFELKYGPSGDSRSALTTLWKETFDSYYKCYFSDKNKYEVAIREVPASGHDILNATGRFGFVLYYTNKDVAQYIKDYLDNWTTHSDAILLFEYYKDIEILKKRIKLKLDDAKHKIVNLVDDCPILNEKKYIGKGVSHDKN